MKTQIIKNSHTGNWLRALVIVGLASFAIAAQTSDAGSVSRQLDDYVAATDKLAPFYGSILVAKDGRIVFHKGFGMANLETGTLNTSETKYRIGSVTKQFTAMAVMMLQERGKLDVQDPVCKFLSSCPAAWQKITLHQLLSHLSGIPNITASPDYVKVKLLPTSPDDAVKRFQEKPLDFEPGTRFAYSNSGYIVLGKVIETVSGTTYDEFLKVHIFAPLGMRNTGYDRRRDVLVGRAEGYVWRNGFVHDQYIDMSVPFAAGGLYSTIEDLFTWERALYTEKLVSKKTLNAIFTPVKENYGYGWVMSEQFGHPNTVHTGSIEGFKSVIARYPRDNATIIVLSNIGNINLSSMMRDLAAIIFGEKYDLPIKREIKAANIDRKVYDAYVGRYDLPMFTLGVTREGDRLMAQPSSGGPKAELIPQSETKFVIREEEGAVFTFVRDEKGVVHHIETTLRGKQYTGKRIE